MAADPRPVDWPLGQLQAAPGTSVRHTGKVLFRREKRIHESGIPSIGLRAPTVPPDYHFFRPDEAPCGLFYCRGVLRAWRIGMPGNANTLLLLMAAALLSPVPASAEDCASAVKNYEQSNKLSGEAPKLDAPAAGENLSDKLAQSGGVLRPPDVGTGVVIPAPKTGDSMETSPSPSPKKPEAAPQAEAGKHAQAESLLQSAREAARNGDETACRTQLQEAQRLMDEK
jgi:hypothetical protein